ncbi:MAG: LPS export ABC transporter periplasmic protein LptC [Elusimicrobia bacterium RIFOXYB2_FULL_49_7]|nr:MAG: LPS export ABC transporter periplasmic protein LptC [Elusimicrobia bacterium RIFOXYB2_FULL_49_7]
MEKINLFLLFFLFLWLPGCKNERLPVSQVRIDTDKMPLQEFKDTTRLSCTENDRRLWTLTTTHLVKYKADGRIYVNPVHITYNTRDGVSLLESDSGQISYAMDTLLAVGNVRICAADGKRLVTSLIGWYKNTGKIISDRFVKFTTEDGDVYSGVGFIANTDLSEWKILRNVRATIHEADKKMQ